MNAAIEGLVFIAILFGVVAILILTIPRHHPGHMVQKGQPVDDEKEG